MAGIRTFVAIALESKLARAVDRQLASTRTAFRQVRWTPAERLHFTLAFLGDMQPQQLPEVFSAVDSAAAEHRPFEVELVGVGGFPDLQRAATLWIGVGAGADSVRRLQADIANRLEPLGFRPEHRPFSPHLTIGRLQRFKRPEPALVERLRQLAGEEFGAFDVRAVAVMRSDLERRGPSYSVMATIPLGGAAHAQ